MRIEVNGKPAGCKLLRIGAEISEPDDVPRILLALSVRGDFFAFPEEGFEEIEREMAGCPLEELAWRFDTLASSKGLRLLGIDGAAIETVLMEAIHGV